MYDVLYSANPKYINMTDDENGPIISYNARAILDLYDFAVKKGYTFLQRALNDIRVATSNYYGCPQIFNLDREVALEDRVSDIKFLDNDEAALTLSTEEAMAHCWFSARFICDRGVSHELVRHEGQSSFAQESTRYCNYSKDKFNQELTFIEPCFLLFDSHGYRVWDVTMKYCEESYFMLLEKGATPQEARSVLPSSLKTEVCMTARLKEWDHFFRLRTATAAHPQMREIVIPLLHVCKGKYITQGFFNSIKEES